MTYKVGIAGCGVVGKRRFDIITKEWPGFDVSAVSDANPAYLDRLPSSLKKLKDFTDLLEQDLDILFVCLPNNLAAAATIGGLKRGMHVLCEKPPGKNLQDIDAVIAEANLHPELKLKYGFNHRYHESVQAAKEIIERRDFGEIVNMRGVYGKSKMVPFEGGWRSERELAGGGILLDQGIHMLDLIRHFGGDFTEVKSFISNDYWGHDVEDNAFAIMRSPRGSLASIHSSATLWQHTFELSITCREGFIELSGILTGSKSYGEERLVMGRRNEKITGASSKEVTHYITDDSWSMEIKEFFEAIVNNHPIEHGRKEDARFLMAQIEAIYHADTPWSSMYYEGGKNEGE
jgi:predicted dehydrogenase